MPLSDTLTLTVLSGTYTAPDGSPLGGQVTFTPSSALTNEAGLPILAATPLTARLQPGTGAFSIPLLNTDNAGLLPAGWQWHVSVSVPGAQANYYFGLPASLGGTADISSLTPASSPPAADVTFVRSVNGQTGDVELADGFGIVPPAGDLSGSTLSPQVTATHLSAPLPVAQGGTGAATGSAALTTLGGVTAAGLAAEASRATTAEGLAAQKSANLGDLASASAARTNLGLGTAATQASSAFANVFSPLSFGAAGDNIADDTAAVQAAFTAAGAAGGIVDLTGRKFRLFSPITIPSGLTVRGGTNQAASSFGELVNPVSDMFTVTGSVNNVIFRDCFLEATSGHVFNVAVNAGVSFWSFQGVKMACFAPGAHAIWYQPAGTTYIDVLVGDNCYLQMAGPVHTDTGCGTTISSTTVTDPAARTADAGLAVWNANLPAGTTIVSAIANTSYVVSAAATATASAQTLLIGGATVPAWYVVSTDNGGNSNTWRRMRVIGNGNPNAPFFHVENQNSSGYCSDNVFEHITAEECPGGIIAALSCNSVTIENVSGFDTTVYTSSLFSLGTSPGFTAPSGSVIIRNSGRRGGILAAGAFDVQAASSVTSLILDNVGPESGSASYSVPAAGTTIRNGAFQGTTVPALAAAGLGTSTAAGARFAGGTASGAPASGTFLAGDFVIDQTGVTWICTAGGSPGTWAPASGAPVSGGLVYIPAQSSAPSGTPAARSGMIPLVFDTTSNQLFAFNGGAWKAVTVS